MQAAWGSQPCRNLCHVTSHPHVLEGSACLWWQAAPKCKWGWICVKVEEEEEMWANLSAQLLLCCRAQNTNSPLNTHTDTLWCTCRLPPPSTVCLFSIHHHCWITLSPPCGAFNCSGSFHCARFSIYLQLSLLRRGNCMECMFSTAMAWQLLPGYGMLKKKNHMAPQRKE